MKKLFLRAFVALAISCSVMSGAAFAEDTSSPPPHSDGGFPPSW